MEGPGQVPDSVEALTAQGVQAAQNGSLHEAIRFFERASAIDPASEGANLNLGTALFQASRVEESLTRIDKALVLNPRSIPARHLRGCALARLGRQLEALTEFDAVVAVAGEDPAVMTNRGNALNMLARFDEALACFDKALAGDPLNRGALVGRSDVLHKLQRHAEALASADQALTVDPGLAEALNNRGNALLALKRYADALASFDRALALNPGYAEALNNRGNVLLALGRRDDARASYARAVSLKPDYADAHYNLGNGLRDEGRLEEAVARYNDALSFAPDSAVTHNNLANVLADLGRREEAMASFRRALAIDPDYAEAHYNQGNVQRQEGRLDAAIASYKMALSLLPGFADAHNSLGSALLEQGMPVEAAESFRQALAFKPNYPGAYSNLLYLHSFTRDVSPEAERRLASEWENIALGKSARDTACAQRSLFDRPGVVLPRSGRKLRVGFVSAELGQHAVAEFLEPLLENLDPNRFHVTLYPTAVRREARVAKLAALADSVKSLVGIPDGRAAEQIRSDAIDVLVDTTSHMAGCRLGIFAHRAAPVQCHYIGYHGTTGLAEMDWFVADEMIVPKSLDAHFRENIWRLPRLWVAYRGDQSLPGSHWAPQPDGAITLGTFNNLAKVRDESLGLWAKVMNALPDSKLLLKDRKGLDPGVQKRIRTGLAEFGISPERVEFAPWTPDWISHMALYDRLDIALDTIPLNSGTTAFDALWMGVPLIALQGNWMGARMTSAMLNALGKPEWIAQDEDEYVEKVRTLARDVDGRKALRTTQRARMAASPLCDAKGLARAIEDALEAMFDLRMTGRQTPIH